MSITLYVVFANVRIVVPVSPSRPISHKLTHSIHNLRASQCYAHVLHWQPYREPFRKTLLRTSAIAIVVGAIVAILSGGLRNWPMDTVLVLWPSFGGHWLELWFLNWLRPRLPAERALQIAARLGVWFAGGVVLAIGMALTAAVLAGIRVERWPAWWFGGLGFIAIELVVHLVPLFSGRPNFYNGRG